MRAHTWVEPSSISDESDEADRLSVPSLVVEATLVGETKSMESAATHGGATVGTAAPAWDDADQAVAALYSANYWSLVRLSVLLVGGVATAEETVQDAFVAMFHAWRRLRDPDKALAYLRKSVVNRSRSVLRHRAVVERYGCDRLPDAPSAEHGTIVESERIEVIKALAKLAARQREALVLRFYDDLSEAEIADAMGISRGTVKCHTARGMAALRSALERFA